MSISGIMQAGRSFIQTGLDCCRKARDFVYQEILPHERTIAATTAVCAGAYLLSRLAFGNTEYVPGLQGNMAYADNIALEGIPGAYLTYAGFSYLKTAVVNRFRQAYDNYQFRQISKWDNENGPKKNPIALFLYSEAASDPNGAFALKYQKKSLDNLRKHFFFIREVYRSDADIARVINKVKKMSRRIGVVLIHGHGSPKKVYCGAEYNYSLYRWLTGEKPYLSSESMHVLSGIPRQAQLLLVSCQAGAKGGLAESIGNSLPLRVTGSSKNLNALTLMLRYSKGDVHLEVRGDPRASYIKHYEGCLEREASFEVDQKASTDRDEELINGRALPVAVEIQAPRQLKQRSA